MNTNDVIRDAIYEAVDSKLFRYGTLAWVILSMSLIVWVYVL